MKERGEKHQSQKGAEVAIISCKRGMTIRRGGEGHQSRGVGKANSPCKRLGTVSLVRERWKAISLFAREGDRKNLLLSPQIIFSYIV